MTPFLKGLQDIGKYTDSDLNIASQYLQIQYMFSAYEEKYFTPPQMTQSINNVLQMFQTTFFHDMLSKKLYSTHSQFKKQF